MASIGKKILSAFMEVTDEQPAVIKPAADKDIPAVAAVNAPGKADNEKFRQYFEKLFQEANLPGPDYYEFSKMIEAMGGITDEKARYSAAFAGLQVQGLEVTQAIQHYRADQHLSDPSDRGPDKALDLPEPGLVDQRPVVHGFVGERVAAAGSAHRRGQFLRELLGYGGVDVNPLGAVADLTAVNDSGSGDRLHGG